MRRSCAPSAKKPLAHTATSCSSSNENQVSSSSDWPRTKIAATPAEEPSTSSWGTSRTNFNQRNNENNTQNNKIMFNIVWRDMSTKKHKTWKGDGTLEVYGNKAVLKDDKGKYLGSSKSFKPQELEEGFQMTLGGKEIELQEQITDMREVFAQRQLQMANREWGAEEWQPEEPPEKKPKGHFVFRPNLVLPTMPQMQTRKSDVRGIKIGQKTTGSSIVEKATGSSRSLETKISSVQSLILPTPDDTPHCKYNKHNRPVHEVHVAAALTQHLREHQRVGVRFLYDCLMGFSVQNQYGVILADDMGLGKTLQCLAVAHTLLRQGPFGGERVLQRVLVVTPSSLTATWNNEITKWLQSERMFAYIVDAKHKLTHYAQQQHMPFVIVSYEMFLANAGDFQQLEFDLLICDEGHRLKNKETKVCSALRDLHISRRILLTGTPLQNDLQEFYTLADFVNPGIYGSYPEFRKYYELPIVQSQCPQADDEVLQLAASRSAELNELSSRFMLRRTQEINRQYLPKKRDYIVFVKPSELQQFMLQRVLEIYEKRKDTILQDLTPLQIITILKKICNHPSLVARTKTPNLLTRNLERHLPDWAEMGPFDSAKLELVQNFLTCHVVENNAKVVIVSNHTKTLNMLQGLCDYLNLQCLRLDGTTPISERNANVAKFNTNDTEQRVFLLSAKAGGMGLNLCGASRLILYDNDWNPATDAQAMSRIWRDGQKHDVQIYRLVTAGTIEEKIFQRQVAKMSLGGCLLSATSNGDAMKFAAEELLDLFTLQQDFSVCQTHASLKCECSGDGKNLNEQARTSNGEQQINELLQWEHYAQPFADDFLVSAGLRESSENILYIFSHQTALSETT